MTRTADTATDDEEEEPFFESLDRIISSSSCSCSNSDNEEHEDTNPDPNSGLAMGGYDIWLSEPLSVSERRSRLLQDMGLGRDQTLPRTDGGIDFGRSASSDRLRCQENVVGVGSPGSAIPRSKSEGSTDRNSASGDHLNPNSTPCSNSFVPHEGSSSICFVNNINDNSHHYNTSNSVPFAANGSSMPCGSVSLNKPPTVKTLRNSYSSVGCNVDLNGDSVTSSGEGEVDAEGENSEMNGTVVIKNLDNGKEFMVDEIREDVGGWNKLQVKEVGTDRRLTLEEFDMTVGHSPIVQELMRRQNVEEGYQDGIDLNSNRDAVTGSKLKKKGSWFKSIRSVASTVKHGAPKERRSSDEKDTSSEKGGRRSSSATDDSQDSSFHGPERVKVRQYGKPCKELSSLFKNQEIQAHNGSIWSIKFSLDGRYLASAGEDCVIHIWQVVETERKGELLMEKNEDGSLLLFLGATGSPEPTTMSPSLDIYPERKRRGRSSLSRKSMNLDHVLVPDNVFGLSEKPICSFQGHLDDVLDLSWSKSQRLLSSSMDKTVRLWHLSSNSCLKVFSHSDYVTCIQFNPVDDNYFISGSLDAKVRIWNIEERQVVDWNDLHEMVTAACYTPDGQGALVGTYKGSCRLYNTSENKLQQKSQINLQNKKKAHYKKITGFQFAPGSSTEVLITSADSRIRVVDGVDLVHKFKGFRNSNSQISAVLAANGKYVVSASEDSYVYVWKHEVDSRPNRSKGITVTRSYENFHSQDVSVAIPWPGISDTWGGQLSNSLYSIELNEPSTVNHPPTPVEYTNPNEHGATGSQWASGCTNSPLNGTISSASNSYFFDRIAATWPEEKLVVAARARSPRVSVDLTNWTTNDSMAAWGLVIVTAGLKGEIRTFQNFGLPVRL